MIRPLVPDPVAVYLCIVSIEDVEAAALRLDPKDRAHLARRLLGSLETLSAEEIDRLWVEEATRRDEAVEAGSLPSRPAETVFRDARARL
jgi:hypothetical protein